MKAGRYLTDYIDFVPHFKRQFSKQDFAMAMGLAVGVRKLGTMFVLPDSGKLKERKGPLELTGDIFRPPYPVCVLEFTGAHDADVPEHAKSTRRIVTTFDHGDRVDIIPITYMDQMGIWAPPIFKFTLYYGEHIAVRIDKEEVSTLTHFNSVMPDLFDKIKNETFGGSLANFAESMAQDYQDELWAYTDFCRVLHDNHVTFDDVEPDAKLNKMRRARGKAPLFTYKVLTIGKKKRKSRHLGGTHASPRSHLRRGYYRTSRNGIRHWVQPCMVKGETDGFVHKDYVVEGTADGCTT
jgi:hypothetical protein